MSSSENQYRIRVVDPSEAVGSSAVQSQWDELARTSPHPFAFRQSPAWWDYTLRDSNEARAAIGVVQALDGPIVGVVPVRTLDYSLLYSVRSFQIAKTRLRVVNVLGSEPLIPDDECLFVNLIRSLLQTFEDCDGVYLEWVSFESACWKLTSRSRDLRRDVLVCLPRRPHKCHFVTVPDSFDHYLAKFKARTRQHLRRQVRRLREHGAGRLECLRIEHEGDVPIFIEAGSQLALQSRFYRNTGGKWLQNTPEMRQKFNQLARRGVLRSYLLRCGDEFCAFSVGFQYNQTLYSSAIGFDERFAKFSPGTTLHNMIIEDLCGHRPPKRMNLDAGEWPYLDALETDSRDGAPVLLLRRTMRNRLRCGLYAAFRSSLEFARRLVARTRRAKSATAPDEQSFEQ
jgi:CelD/BcsL family acetyltransferase involved in cellulose biosynthesis